MTDFIELPILLYDKKMDDLGIKTEDIPVSIYVKKDKIIAYRKSFNDKMEERSCVYLEGNDSWIIELKIDELYKKLTLK
jgi:hypothetical protein